MLQLSTASSRPVHDFRVALPSESLPGLGNWQPLRLVGEGTLSQVYRARPVSDSSPAAACYAVKVLKREWQEHAPAIELVRREVEVGRHVAHPHVISILDWSVVHEPFFVVMPLLAGTTLEEKLHRGALPLSFSLWVARQTAQALEGLHAGGWMHADVKPSNIFIGDDGHATLLDLGFARPARQETTVADRPLVGTLAYMAPESLTSSSASDIRSDIYSLGVTLYRMLSGHLPYDADNALEAAARQRAAAPDRLRRSNPSLPVEVEQLVRQMLAKEPLRRPQNPGEVVQRLVALEIESLAARIPA
jgi:serine/threonine-protein kinase